MAADNEGPGFDVEEGRGPVGAGVKAETATPREALERNAPALGDLVDGAFALMRARARGEARPIALPWRDVSEKLGGGLWPGLHILTAATGQGKTQFALQAAWTAARRGTPVLYVGLELDAPGVVARLLSFAAAEANGGRVPKWSDFYLGRGDAAQLEALELAHRDTLAALPLRAEFGPPHGWNYTTLEPRVAAMREEHPEAAPGGRPMLVVLDFLQAVGPAEGRREDLRERISRAAYVGRQVARTYGAAVLMISSTSREGAKRLSGAGDDEAPDFTNDATAAEFVGMGKESGDIEYAADTVLSMLPGEWDRDARRRSIWLAVAKQRAGGPGWCSLEFDGATFTEGLSP